MLVPRQLGEGLALPATASALPWHLLALERPKARVKKH